jgi:hypothetical protein
MDPDANCADSRSSPAYRYRGTLGRHRHLCHADSQRFRIHRLVLGIRSHAMGTVEDEFGSIAYVVD